MNKCMLTSVKSDWGTPWSLYNELDDQYNFNLDACADETNHKCEYYYTIEDNALMINWSSVTFCNPPYGRNIGRWVAKAYWEATKHYNTVVMLLPARTDTEWFHKYCTRGYITFIRGRVTFEGAKDPSPFPSMVVVFNGKPAVLKAKCYK